MKKFLIVFLLSCALLIVADHKGFVSKARYLERIKDLQQVCKLPQLQIQSIMNDTDYDLILTVGCDTIRYPLPSGSTIDFARVFDDYQEKISFQDRCDGIFDQFHFMVAEQDFSGDIFKENGAHCSVDVMIDIDSSLGVLSAAIEEMQVRFGIQYFERKEKIYSYLHVPVYFFHKEYIPVTIEIRACSSVIEKMRDKFFLHL